MDSRPIGIFDSGVGGFSIYLSLKKLLPKENFIYIADQKNFPYGEKTSSEVKSYSLKITNFLLRKNCKIVVIGCNTATISSIDKLRKAYPKISFVGTVPVIKPAVNLSKSGHILVLSTEITKNSKTLQALIKNYGKTRKIYNLSSPILIRIIEKGLINDIKKAIQQELKILQKDQLIDTVASGCTHFYFLGKYFKLWLKRKINFIEPSLPVARRVKDLLIRNNSRTKEKYGDMFFTTGEPALFNETIRKISGFRLKSVKIVL